MNTKIVYQCDQNGYYIGITEADESPLEPGVLLIPAGCVEVSPPTLDGGHQKARFIDGDWVVEQVPVAEPESPAEPTPLTADQIRAQVETQRLRAYADPLTGSDRYFAEAARLQAMGAAQEEIDAANAAGANRYAEIQNAYPWPA